MDRLFLLEFQSKSIIFLLFITLGSSGILFITNRIKIFFSRRTSGVVSPSELPDSPTQTVPPTPVRPSNQELITPRTRKLTPQARSSNTLIMPTTSSTVVKQSVFEDATSSFKDENTPIEFSRATSLSSLTIDDEIKPNKVGKHICTVYYFSQHLAFNFALNSQKASGIS